MNVSNIRNSHNFSLLNDRSQFAYCPLIWIFCLNIDMQRVEKIQ